jgi:hypothetical protein
MNLETEKLTIGICSPGYVSTLFMASIIDILRSQKVCGQFITLQGSGVISRLRNQVVSTFMQVTDDDWLLMVDTDQRFPLESFKKLVEAADAKERPIVSGVVFGGFETGSIYLEPVPCIFRLDHEEGGLRSFHDYPADSIVAVDATGTGCLLVHRSVFEKFRAEADPHQGDRWCYFQDLPMNGEWIGEDLLFCLKAVSYGFPIHAVTGAILPHERRYWLDERHHQDFRRFGQPPHMGKTPSTAD